MWWADIEVPNASVDKSSREASACYPRRTFYLLSDDLSTKNHRITMTDFHLCSIHQSYSQVNIYHYALQQWELFEFTFVHLRYFLGGNRPS